MKISARGRYALQALFDLAHHSHGRPVPLHAIAERQGMSLPFLEQIFNKLKKAGFVSSFRGPRGGYTLSLPCDRVTVGEVLRLMDGGFSNVSEAHRNPFPEPGSDDAMSRLLWRRFDEHVTAFLDSVSLADLCVETRRRRCGDCSCPDHRGSLETRRAPTA